jgi:hydroxyethylthiazole kinase-like uncharacterized protein yjeF
MSSPPRPEPARGGLTQIGADLLREWPLPALNEGGDKADRGWVMCVGGSPELPGAIILAGTAALRAGAGILCIGVPRSISLAVGVAVPEALAYGVRSTRGGGIDPAEAAEIARRATGVHAVLIGPGMTDVRSTARLLAALLPRLTDARVVVLDALALDAATHVLQRVRDSAPRVVMTPHSGEMARLLDLTIEEVEAQPVEIARQAATAFGAVIALKRADTVVVTPAGDAYTYVEGGVGLATSGSGDTLAGIIVGLAARGADAAQAAIWGVYLHGTAGNRLSRGTGRIGFLARELLAQVPPILAELEPA